MEPNDELIENFDTPEGDASALESAYGPDDDGCDGGGYDDY